VCPAVSSYLNAAAETCGGPFCEQMVLTASGGIYYTDDIVLASRPIVPMIDTACGGGKGKRELKIGNKVFKGKKTGKLVAKVAGDASVSKVDSGNDKSLYTGEATIYFGPMTINSRFHSVKYTQGW